MLFVIEDIRRKPKRVLMLFSLLLFLLVLMCCGSIKVATDGRETNTFEVSLDSGFYAESQHIEVKTSKGTRVYYTDDYSAPDKEGGMLYEEAILLEVAEQTVPYTLRFKAYYPDGTESEVNTYTYFVGEDVDDRYTTKVLHLAGEPEDLFGYEAGIFVFGKRFDDYMALHPDAYLGGGVDANFEMRGVDAEREVYIQYFSKEGELLLEQNCGIRIYGETTRLKNQKSFKLYARKEYDVADDFNYPMVEKLVSDVDGTIAQKHERLIVRSGGTDNGYGYIRSELVAELASLAGYPDVMHSNPVSVYINGQYYGVYWMSNAYDEQYFENRYGEYAGEFVVLGGIDAKKEDDAETQVYVDRYNELYARFSEMDLTQDENMRLLNEFIDVENYLQYFAIQNYVGNWDSIDNNLKVYRYVAPDDVYSEDGPFDGRYRHLLFDVDFGFGLETQFGRFGGGPSTRTLQRFMQASPLFASLMQREDCRNYFMRYTCDLMNGPMSYASVAEVLREKHGQRETELRYMLEETDVQKGSICVEWEGDGIEKYETVERNCQKILTYADERPVAVLSDFVERFGLRYEDAYTLYVTNHSHNSGIVLNQMTSYQTSFEGKGFSFIDVEVKPSLSENEQFEYWIINGEKCYEDTLILSEEYVVDGAIYLELVTSEVEESVLEILAIKAKGNNDFIEVVNNSSKDISTKGYYLSDSEEIYKCALPILVLSPGESIRLWGEDSISFESVGDFALNFNIRQGECITLTRKGMALERVEVPDLSLDGVYCKQKSGTRYCEQLLD